MVKNVCYCLHFLTEVSQTGITKTMETGITVKTGITVGTSIGTVVGSIGKAITVSGIGDGGSVVVEDTVIGGDNSGGTGDHSGISITLLSVSSLGGVGGKVLSGGGGNLRGQLRGNGKLRVEGGGDKRLGVEGRGNKGLGVEGRGNQRLRVEDGKSGVLNTESGSVSDVGDGLELIVGINIRVSTVDTGVSVSNLVLGRVQVGVSVVQVLEFILGVELASDIGSSGVGHIGSGGGGSGHNGSSSGGQSISRSSSISSSGIRSSCVGSSSIRIASEGSSYKAMVDYNLLGSVNGSDENC